jgi:diamine N-acetyltransferase
MNVRLEPVTASNWREVVKLSVEEGQERFVAPNLFSVAQARVKPWWEIEAVRAEEGLVRFVMYGRPPEEGYYWVCRLMVDRRHQGKGYGRAAMAETLERLRARGDCAEIRISFVPDNAAARALYLGLGFEDRGIVEDGEVVLVLPVARAGGDRAS